MSDFKHVQTGQPMRIAASTYNKMLDATRAHNERTIATAAGRLAETPPGTVLVRNDSGADLDQFAVLGIDTPIILPADNEDEFRARVALSCVVPALPTHIGRFVILAEPLAVGAVGRAHADGVTVARLRVGVAADRGRSATPIAGDTTVLALRSGGAAQVLWREEPALPGDVWSIIRLGSPVDGTWFRIAGGTQDGTNNRWIYTGKRLGGQDRRWVRGDVGRRHRRPDNLHALFIGGKDQRKQRDLRERRQPGQPGRGE